MARLEFSIFTVLIILSRSGGSVACIFPVVSRPERNGGTERQISASMTKYILFNIVKLFPVNVAMLNKALCRLL